jgi:uncharacterized protein YjbI with pentapeptide repeats
MRNIPGKLLAVPARMATNAELLSREQLFSDEEKRSLQGLMLSNTCFDRVDFRDADLADAVFDSVSLVACDFRGARLTLATFQRCDLRGALFDRATLLRGSRFDGSNLLGARGLSRSGRAQVHRTGGILHVSLLA